MPSLTEGTLEFHFPDAWKVAKFDAWSFYRNQFQSVCGASKAIDLLAIEPRVCCWVIEVKDYRRHQRTKVIDLADEVARKIRDSLAAIVVARVNANVAEEKRLAQSATRTPKIRVVLHLIQPKKHSALFPRAIDPADVLQRLKQLIRAIDPRPLLIEAFEDERIQWTVTRSNA